MMWAGHSALCPEHGVSKEGPFGSRGIRVESGVIRESWKSEVGAWWRVAWIMGRREQPSMSAREV